MSQTLRSVLVATTTIFTAVFSTTPAFAATIDIANPASLLRFDRDGVAVAKREVQLTPEGVNASDCQREQRIRFPLRLSAFEANASLSAWAAPQGVDCSAPTNRSGPSAMCRSLVATIPLTQAIDVDVPVRELVIAAAPGGPTDESVCGDVDKTSVEVQFLYFAPGAPDTPAATQAHVVEIDTVGPPAPSGVTAAFVEGKAEIAWQVDPSQKSTTAGTTIHCGRSRDGVCEATEMGECSRTLGPNAGKGLVGTDADGAALAQGTTYTFAVATLDAFGNGELSAPVCASLPAEEEGGCSMSSRSRSKNASSFAAGALALGLFLAARRRRR